MDDDAVRPTLLSRMTEAVVLEQVAPGEEDDPQAFAELAVGAVFAMGDLLRPLDVVVTFACADPVSTYPRERPVPPVRAQLLVPADLPAGVDTPPVYTDATRVEIPRLDAAAVLDVVARGLAQRCPDGDDERPATRFITTWHELRVTAAAVRLPQVLAATTAGAGTIELADRGGTVAVPVTSADGGAWVTGPRPPSTLWSPVEVLLRNEAGLLTLTVSTWWSLWTASGAGHADVAALDDRLRAAGWTDPDPGADW